MRHSKRSILTTDDVDSALRLRNVEVVKYFPFLDLVMNFSRRRSSLLSHVKNGLDSLLWKLDSVFFCVL
jgi:hypothetical protein